jgi:uncharacterized membrane protein YhaH (DUF805 family)
MNGYRDAMRQYATFRGRTSRETFLQAQWVFLPLAALSFGVFGFPLVGDETGMGSRSIWPILAFLSIVVPHAVPWAALMVRRLHDMDRTGEWAVLALVPVGFIVPFPMVGLVIWGTRPGTPGPNRFGPDPLGGDVPASAPAPAAAVAVGANASATPTTLDRRDLVAELERLASLKATGTLSETEFEVLKAQTLAQGRGA